MSIMSEIEEEESMMDLDLGNIEEMPDFSEE